jgi:dTDP-4-dehydrorhamnose 3,5-epimerase-like enzyme
LSYRNLDPGRPVQDFLPMSVLEGRVGEGPGGEVLVIERETGHPTIAGVEVAQAQTFINERRVLVVSYNSEEPPGTLGYTVVVRPGYSVGDHYHHHRGERIIVLHGRAQFRMQDRRPDSPTRDRVNVFTLDYPGSAVRVPPGVAHAIIADGVPTVLQVLASSDYDPADDVHVVLSSMAVPAAGPARSL